MVLLLFHSQLFLKRSHMKMSFSSRSRQLARADDSFRFGIQIKFENNLHTMKMMLALLFYTLFLLVVTIFARNSFLVSLFISLTALTQSKKYHTVACELPEFFLVCELFCWFVKFTADLN